MTAAERIMKKKAHIKAEMDRAMPKAQSDELWRAATEKLDSILVRYAALPKGVHMHTDKRIFPSAAIYLTVKGVFGQREAYSIIENAAAQGCKGIAKKLAFLMRIPGMRGLFISMWDPLTRRIFGTNSGFQNVFYPKEKGAYRMDIIACPYCRYFTELGCPELTKIFCENDERVYGNLPGLEFRRTGTLGRGADRCDFYIGKTELTEKKTSRE